MTLARSNGEELASLTTVQSGSMYRLQADEQQIAGGVDTAASDTSSFFILPSLTDRSRRSTYHRSGKRVLDLVVAGTALVVLSPVMIVAWCVLRITLGRDVVITQDRVGLDGETFGMYKFRTMHWSRRSEERPFDGIDRRVSHKVDHDPRHTRVGRVMRKLSLDELPQLFNVLDGSMSVVGPRPELASVVDRIGERGHVRHSVKPGMTGEWQVTGRQTGTLLHESFDCDLPYLSRVTFRNDVGILIRTIAVVMQRGGR